MTSITFSSNYTPRREKNGYTKQPFFRIIEDGLPKEGQPLRLPVGNDHNAANDLSELLVIDCWESQLFQNKLDSTLSDKNQ